MINLYYKPNLTDRDKPIQWLQRIIDPISKSICPLQGFKCPSNKPCDCKLYCTNDAEFIPFHISKDEQNIYVMNKRLTQGTYCLPKGADKCNLNVNYHVFSLAGWSCLPLNEVIFKGDKKRACKNEEAKDNKLNILWDYKENKEAGDNIYHYYEKLPTGNLRYRCICGSESIDGTRMISVFPFICSPDYCLRDIINPEPSMGWNGKICDCKTYPHLDPNDLTSPCRRNKSRIKEVEFLGRVDCMTNDSFVPQALFCPTTDKEMFFKQFIHSGSDIENFVQELIALQKI